MKYNDVCTNCHTPYCETIDSVCYTCTNMLYRELRMNYTVLRKGVEETRSSLEYSYYNHYKVNAGHYDNELKTLLDNTKV